MKRIAFMLLACFASLAAAQPDPATPPTIRVLNCTEGGCHAPIVDYKFVHGPTAVGACDVCHLYDKVEDHTFKLKNTGTDLCAFCHIDKVLPDGPVVHEPFGKGECATCHNPHGGETRTLMKTKVVGDLCLTCHDDTAHGSFKHEPAAAGRCNECHRSHSADEPKLLTMPSRKLCLSCHEPVATKIEHAQDVHEPAAEDCLKCHLPHSSEFPHTLTMEPKALCVSCHEKQEQEALAAEHKHSAVFEDRACLNCHQPHASSHDKLIAEDGVGACLECHDEPIKLPDDRVVQAVSEVRAEKHFLHGPIKDQTCTGCHYPHGSKQGFLLKAPYVDLFYQPFKLESYALCFTCHMKELVLEKEATTGTNFRDGTRNLHYVHVTEPEQGRGCVACHNNHAAVTKPLIVDSVPYGQWRIPLNFKQSEIGGSCASGCHTAKSYDRGGPPMVKQIAPFTPKPGVTTAAPEAPAPEQPGSEAPAPELPAVEPTASGDGTAE